MELFDLAHTCCFTGHRPEKLGIYEGVARAWLEDRIDEAIADGYTTFITGCAKGADLWAGDIVLKRRAENPDIRLIAASPWPDCYRSWDDRWKEEYFRVVWQSDQVDYMGEHYFRGIYEVRNRWMADRSGRVIALYTGAPGGTKRTVDYARKLGREVILYPYRSEESALPLR